MTENLAPAAMFPESNVCAPDGTLTEVTVWAVESLFVHVMVAFTPGTTVIVVGEYPGEFVFVPAPLSIETGVAGGATVVLVELDELVALAVVVVVAGGMLQQAYQTPASPCPLVWPGAVSLM